MELLREMRKNRVYFVMLLPGVLCLLLFNYAPMAGIVMAFENFNYRKGVFHSPFVGVDNFRFLFATKDAFVITRNTLLYNLVFIVSTLVFAVFIAIAIHEIRNRKLVRLYQSVLILPNFVSWVVASYLFFAFFSVDKGFINHALANFGLAPISWYSEPKHWPGILTFANLWKNAGYNSIIYLAAITGFDTEYYEAALLDGATKLQQTRHITLPLLKPMMIILTLLAIGKVFYADFGLFYQIPRNSGQLYGVTSVIDTYVFNGLMNTGDIGMSSAAGLYQSVVGFVLVMASNLFVKRIDPEYALF